MPRRRGDQVTLQEAVYSQVIASNKLVCAKEIAIALGISTQTARTYLKSLNIEGKLAAGSLGHILVYAKDPSTLGHATDVLKAPPHPESASQTKILKLIQERTLNGSRTYRADIQGLLDLSRTAINTNLAHLVRMGKLKRIGRGFGKPYYREPLPDDDLEEQAFRTDLLTVIGRQSGPKALMAAVLASATMDLWDTLSAYHHDAIDWFQSRNVDWLYSYRSICYALDINPNWYITKFARKYNIDFPVGD